METNKNQTSILDNKKLKWWHIPMIIGAFFFIMGMLYLAGGNYHGQQMPITDNYSSQIEIWQEEYSKIEQTEKQTQIDKCESIKLGAYIKMQANAVNPEVHPLTQTQLLDLDKKRKLDCNPENSLIPTAKALSFDQSGIEVVPPVKSTEKEQKSIGTWKITRYYTPIKDQKRYFSGNFANDFYVNCSGDCLVTANGYRLAEKDEYKVVACPSTIKFGTHLHIDGIGEVVCHDRGGAIKGKRLDVWAGIGDRGLDNIYARPETSGYHEVSIIL